MKLLCAALLSVFAVVFLAGPFEAAPAARSEDVASVDAILGALYEVISGPAGEQIDWDRFRSLFTARGQIIGDPTGGISAHRMVDR